MKYEHIFPLLTDQEFAVLYWKCQGMKHEEIALKFHYSMGWIQEHSSKAQVKLGIMGHPSKREKILEEEVCPALFEWVKQNPERVKALPPPIEQPSPPSGSSSNVERPASPRKEKGKKDPPIIVIPNRGSLPGPVIGPSLIVRLFRWLLFAFAALIILSGVGFYFYRLGAGNIPAPKVTEIVTERVITATFPPTPLASATNALPVVDATAATSISGLIINSVAPHLPSATPTLTATPFVPPADGILFQDDFEIGKLDKWNRYTGSWLITDGKLSKLTEDPYSSQYDWIGIPQLPVKNYIVSLDITELKSNDYPPIAIVVRQNVAAAKYIGAEIDFWPWIYLSLISNGTSNRTVIGDQNNKFTFPTGTEANVEIEVKDDTYKLRVNGQQVQDVSITGYDSPEIRIGLHCSDYPGCPTFDNFKVMYLP